LDELLRDQQAMLNNDLVGIVKVKDRHVIWANTAFEQMFGYASGELKGTSTRQTYKDDASYESFGAEAYPALKAGTAYRSQIEQRCKDGKLIWVDVSGERLNATTGESLWTFLDITERKAMESQLTLSEAKLRGVIEGAADAIFVVNQTGQYQYTNQQATRLLGYTPQEYLSMSLTDITPPEDVEDVTRQFQELLSTGVLRTELRLKRKDGALAPVELNASMLPDGTLFGSCRDIFKRKQMEDQIRQLAFHDTLTQLPNRRLLLDRLNNAMSASKRSGKYGALMFLDLDHFKPLNDEHGHEAGDVLLVEAARRLKHCVREIDTVARFGGDEFTVMLSELNADKNESTKQACAVAEKIRNALAEPYQIVLSHGDSVTTSITHHCTASIGVALFINHFGSATDILSWADGAMYAAKSGGRNRVHLYQEASAR
jgi:diguanylate cyclase (GGDEF)-like protein/PAS domain S-box-containing protein